MPGTDVLVHNEEVKRKDTELRRSLGIKPDFENHTRRAADRGACEAVPGDVGTAEV